MKIKTLPQEFSVCKVKDFTQVNWDDEYCFTGKIEDENSLVCSTEVVPQKCIAGEDGWRALILANHQIGIFATSTYNTDYILTKQENFEKALQAVKGDQ